VRRYQGALIAFAIFTLLLLFGTHRQGGAGAAAQASQGSAPSPSAPVAGITPQPSPASAESATTGTAAATPAYDRAYEWPLVHYDARKLWRYSEGAGVTIAIIGTGVNAGHPDLSGVVVEALSLTTPQPPGSLDTEIAGLIAGQGSAADPAVVTGLAPEAKLIDIQVTTDATQVTADEIVAGIKAAAAAGAQIIDVPLGVASDPGDEVQNEVLAVAADHLLIASAAPDGSELFPAADEGAVAVAAADYSLHPTGSLTRENPKFYTPNAIYAPGTGLYSTSGQNGYAGNLSGNPIATAYVAATAALLEAAHLGTAATMNSLSAYALRAPGKSQQLGVLDPGLAIQRNGIQPGAGVSPPAPPPGPSASASTQSSPATQQASVTMSVSASQPVSASNTRPPKASPPSAGYPAWSIALIVALVVLIVIVVVLAIVTRNGSKPPDGPGTRQPRNWGLETR
jgi:hypothetical protein